MVSLTQLGQFEHAIEKYKKINTNTVAMLAGEALLFNKIISGVPENSNFFTVAKKIRENMGDIKDGKMEKEILNIYKINMDFIKEALKNPIQNPYMQGLIDAVTKFSLKTNVLLIGCLLYTSPSPRD